MTFDAKGNVMKRLAIIFAAACLLAGLLGHSSAHATQCEKPETIKQIINVIACHDFKVHNFQADMPGVADVCPEGVTQEQLASSADATYAQDMKALDTQNVNETQREFLTDLYKANRDTAKILLTAFTVKDAHATDYQPEISRYTCMATYTGDPQKMAVILHWLTLATYAASKDSNAILAFMIMSAAAEKNNEPKFKEALAIATASTKVLWPKYIGPSNFTYYVQQTETGTIYQVEALEFSKPLRSGP